MRRRDFMRGGLALSIGADAPGSGAQGKFPDKPITLVVPFAAGGGGDVIARAIAKGLSDRTGSPVIVENRTGAGGNIGAAYVLKSPANGYTLLNMSTTYAIQAGVARLAFDPIADMQPIIMVSRDPGIVIVHPSSPLKNLKDLLAAAQGAPGKLTYASAGIGSIAHLGVEELAFIMGIKLAHVPYKGSSQAFGDLVGQHVDMMLTAATFGAPFIKSGRVRALAVVGEQRNPYLPEIPTFAEQGYPSYQLYDWKAVAGPRGIPAEVVSWLNRELNGVLKDKAIVEKFESEGTTLVGGTPEQLMQTVRSEAERWKMVARQANVRME